MKRLSLVAAASIVTLGCAEKPQEVVEEKPVIESRSDCYTVVLFDKFEVKPPEEGVPPEHARFLGKWQNGAWNGEWCHDLLVTEVTKAGTVKVVEMHAPYEPWGQPASAFQRTGTIDKDGHMRFAYGTETISYRYESGKLMAKRSGIHGNLEAMLLLEGYAPLPAPRPVSLLASDAPQSTDPALSTDAAPVTDAALSTGATQETGAVQDASKTLP